MARGVRSDAQLFAAWGDGDTRAGNELFQRHFESIRRFFANKAEREVEDLVQRTFLGCVQARARFAGRASFRTFLFGIAHHILHEFFRSKQHDRALDFGSISVADLATGPTSIIARAQEQRALLTALRQVPIDLQIVLELHYWEKMTAAEIGEVLGIPANTAGSRLRRAKERLRECLRSSSESAAVAESTAADLDGWAASVRGLLGAS
jgi:RNA polymerase sigma factor (sigma-70 family)